MADSGAKAFANPASDERRTNKMMGGGKEYRNPLAIETSFNVAGCSKA
jgi:hypothetical protein